MLGRGVSLGNTLEPPAEGDWGMRLDERLFARAKEAGFDTVRLPVRWSNHADAAPPYRIDERFFRRVDFAIAQALQRGLNIVVNMHHHRQLDGDRLDPGETRVDDAVLEDRFVALWAQIAERYRTTSDKVIFELYNEPHGRLNAERWNALLHRALATVRRSNPERWIVVGPAGHYRAADLRALELPPSDRRLIVAVHVYEPYTFTHQGATWIPGSAAWLGTSCCSAAQRDEVARVLDTAKQWSDREARPVWVGEFGSVESADYDSRVRYTRMMRAQIEARGLAWAYWDLASNFGILHLEQGIWHTALKDALVGSPRLLSP